MIPKDLGVILYLCHIKAMWVIYIYVNILYIMPERHIKVTFDIHMTFSNITILYSHTIAGLIYNIIICNISLDYIINISNYIITYADI